MPFLMFGSLANENCLRGRGHGRGRSPSRAEARLRYLDIARTYANLRKELVDHAREFVLDARRFFPTRSIAKYIGFDLGFCT